MGSALRRGQYPGASGILRDDQKGIKWSGRWSVHVFESEITASASVLGRYKISWWDAQVVNSANELGCAVLWTEDLNHGQRYGGVTVRNPFL